MKPDDLCAECGMRFLEHDPDDFVPMVKVSAMTSAHRQPRYTALDLWRIFCAGITTGMILMVIIL